MHGFALLFISFPTFIYSCLLTENLTAANLHRSLHSKQFLYGNVEEDISILPSLPFYNLTGNKIIEEKNSTKYLDRVGLIYVMNLKCKQTCLQAAKDPEVKECLNAAGLIERSFMSCVSNLNYFGKKLGPHVDTIFKVMRFSQVLANPKALWPEFKEILQGGLDALKFPQVKKNFG